MMLTPFLKRIKHTIYKNLIEPVLTSVSPIQEVAWGTAIGLWIGLTPTVGIQSYIVFLVWGICKYGFNFKFDLLISSAMVWVTNPITIFFIYYGFLVTGKEMFVLVGIEWPETTYESFNLSLSTILNNENLSSFERISEAIYYIFYDLGIPMVTGCLLYAFFFSILSYFLVKKYLRLYRVRKAEREGMSYENWRTKYEN